MSNEQERSTTPAEDRDEWRTPPYIYEWAESRWGLFDVDLAATENNALCKEFITIEMDSLRPRWNNWTNGWCNPPYSRNQRKDWLQRAAWECECGFSSTWFIPCPNGEQYWNYVFDIASEIVFIQGRIAYLRPDGTPAQGNRFGSVLVRYSGVPKTTDLYNVNRDDMR